MKIFCKDKSHVQWLPAELLYGKKEVSDLIKKINAIPNPYTALEECKGAFEDCRLQILRLLTKHE